jgi:hypothetical protein
MVVDKKTDFREIARSGGMVLSYALAISFSARGTPLAACTLC